MARNEPSEYDVNPYLKYARRRLMAKPSLTTIGPAIYVVATKHGKTTRFYYGSTLKEIRAHLKDGQEFTYARFERGNVRSGTFNGNTLTTSA